MKNKTPYIDNFIEREIKFGYGKKIYFAEFTTWGGWVVTDEKRNEVPQHSQAARYFYLNYPNIKTVP